MDFRSVTAEQLLDALPNTGEDDKWELKSATYLNEKVRLKKELGKQVSAFANSGGGYLVFGVSDDRQLEPCAMVKGRQPMEDFLSALVEQSVEYPIRHFRIHKVHFQDDKQKVVFVVEIDDSPAAPHQAKDEKTYYYRISGHSKPAPHFHLELLRNRLTKPVLEIKEIEFKTISRPIKQNHPKWMVTLVMAVENASLQVATNWGVHMNQGNKLQKWRLPRVGGTLEKGLTLRGQSPDLLPAETAVIRQAFEVRAVDNNWEKLHQGFALTFRAATQCGLSEAIQYAQSEPINLTPRVIFPPPQ